ncbi:MAG TPA: 2-succinyl-5-enolpyruvyl-6-hydroxy-3-cyclohexene-1-carboxylic-acid synthase [Microthrixaceae bacterium]|nr:2-succinyl-5-enolpyruvyl-6-hydroxy-3-cyclohexene-1-carboxylic-acid synthase [Microthrixaceae bacterium]
MSTQRDTGPTDAPGASGTGAKEADKVQGPGDAAATFCATLVDEWVARGLTDAVLSPGSRSTPMALALSADERVKLHVHHDERSAAFMALGNSLASRTPTVILCTSGTAATELHSAVVEAHQAHVPLLVLTADRPPELQNVGAPQTIDQRNLYGRAVRWYCEPGVPSHSDRTDWRELAAESWDRCVGPVAGPVHLNLAFREPLIGIPGELPQRMGHGSGPSGPGSDDFSSGAGAGSADAHSAGAGPAGAGPAGAANPGGLAEGTLAKLVNAFSSSSGVIVAGVRASRSQSDAHAVHLLADHLGWPVIADGPSGCRLEVLGCITAFDGILKHQGFVEENQPDVILRIGGLLTSKALNRWIAESPAKKFGLDPDDGQPDPDKVFRVPIVAPVAVVCNQLRSRITEVSEASWRERWVEAERAAVNAIDSTLSRHSEATEPALALDVFTLLSGDGTVVVSSSMPVRDAECYAPPRSDLRVLANRGANGIDGVSSTAVGAALGGSPTALLIGDIAFLHDTNALLGLMKRRVNLLLIVMDNRGGGIFSMLPVKDAISNEQFEELFGTPHDVDLVALAGAHGVPAERVSTRTGAQAAIAGALTRGGPRIVVVETQRDANRRVHQELEVAIHTALDRILTITG